MGLLDNTTHKQYYEGDNLGNYQFVTIDDIVNQFMVSYVGENKIIPKIKKIDVAFWAQRALQELSFDTFKSFKSQEIELPPTLVMPLPHDYVSYTKLSWVDSSGIKHPLYPTKHTNNPFDIWQYDNGKYSFPSGTELVVNHDFEEALASPWVTVDAGATLTGSYNGAVDIDSGKLTWRHVGKNGQGAYNWTHLCVAYQAIDVSDQAYVTLSADGVSEIKSYTATSTLAGTTSPTLRVGLSTSPPINDHLHVVGSGSYPANTNANIVAFNLTNNDGDASYLEWTNGEASTKEIEYIDVSQHSTIYVWALSWMDFSTFPGAGVAITGNTLDNVSVTNANASTMLQASSGNKKNSTTWENYKSITPSENNNDDYEDDTYWHNGGMRYGLEPSHAQVNGSFFIDDRLGRIHFSSNVSGKNVILDYLSDSLGTDEEMKVHKFAEDAMYKWIAHAVISTSSYGQQLAPRFQREKFAAVRKAKLRLSNIKLEELTQILRGKSKQIKH